MDRLFALIREQLFQILFAKSSEYNRARKGLHALQRHLPRHYLQIVGYELVSVQGWFLRWRPSIVGWPRWSVLAEWMKIYD